MTSPRRSPAPRFATPRTPERPTLGGKVAQVAEWLGTPLLPWQRLVADVAFEVDPDTGRLVYREVVLTVPRQAGKSTLLCAAAVHRCLAADGFGGPQRVVYGAQNGVYARAKWLDEHVPTLERSSIGTRRPPLFRVRRTNGHEAVIWSNGSRWGITASTEKAGHGGTVDLVQLDEAFAHTDARLEQGLRPTMITRPQPQFWVVSTAGTPESTYLWGKVEAGRERVRDDAREGVAYFEWSAPDDLDPADPDTWWSCHPALGHTVDVAAIQADYESMALPEFSRAYLNRWDPRKAAPVIPLDVWVDLDDLYSEIVGPVALAFDVAPDQSWSAIAAAGRRSDGLLHVEVVEHRPGTAWLPHALGEIVAAQAPKVVVADWTGPAGSLKTAVEQMRLPVRAVSATEHTQACGQFFTAVHGRLLRHLPQAQLVSAIDGATRRPLGDAWAWSRKSSSVDICPLVAVTLAAWALDAAPPTVNPLECVW